MDSPIVIAILDSPIALAVVAFLIIYMSFVLIRLFADFFLVAIALGSAYIIYHIPNQDWYTVFKMIVEETPFLMSVFGTTLPDTPDHKTILTISSLITSVAILISIPFLPFSATYRVLFGMETSVFRRRESKVRHWIRDEIRRYLKSED